MSIVIDKNKDFTDVQISAGGGPHSSSRFEVSRDDDAKSTTSSVRYGVPHRFAYEGDRSKLTLEGAGVDLLVNDRNTFDTDERQTPLGSDININSSANTDGDIHLELPKGDSTIRMRGYDSDHSERSHDRENRMHDVNFRLTEDNSPRDRRHATQHSSQWREMSGQGWSQGGIPHGDAGSERSIDMRRSEVDHDGVNSNRSNLFTPQDVQRQKQEILHQVRRLQDRGAYIGKCADFTMDTSLEEMKFEYERIRKERSTDRGVRKYRGWLTTAVNFMEMMNFRFSPYKLKLDGWAANVEDNIADYDEVFEDLHAKYEGPSTAPPELRLLGSLLVSAFGVHLTNSMMEGSPIANIQDVFRQRPDLKQEFQTAAAQTTAEKNPVFGDMYHAAQAMRGQDQPFSSHKPGSPKQRSEMRPPTNINELVKQAERPGEVTESRRTPDAKHSVRPIDVSLGKSQKEDDTMSFALSDLNDFDRLSTVTDVEGNKNHRTNILKRPNSGPNRRNRFPVRPRRQDAGLVVDI